MKPMNQTSPPLIESPCVLNCCLDEQEICMGCGRSLDEILGWWDADEEARRIIVRNAQQRKSK